MKFPEQYRWKEGPGPMFGSEEGDEWGFFIIPSHKAPGNNALKIMATAGHDDYGEAGKWEHVSVSLRDNPAKCPTWEAMCFVKSLFWEDEECVVQFHPTKSEYVNRHKGCLHLWKLRSEEFPMPPRECVG